MKGLPPEVLAEITDLVYAEASCMWRIAANIYQDSTLDDTSGFIALEQGHCCTPHGRQANNLGSCKYKVLLPHVGTRIEQ